MRRNKASWGILYTHVIALEVAKVAKALLALLIESAEIGAHHTFECYCIYLNLLVHQVAIRLQAFLPRNAEVFTWSQRVAGRSPSWRISIHRDISLNYNSVQAEHVVEVLKGRGVIKQATVVIAMTSNRAGSFEGVGVGGKSKAWISDLAQNFSHIPVVEQDVAH